MTKMTKSFFLKKNHETHQIDQQNALNMKIYVVGVKNNKNGSKLAKTSRQNLVIVISSSGGGGPGGGGHPPSLYPPLGCRVAEAVPDLWLSLCQPQLPSWSCKLCWPKMCSPICSADLGGLHLWRIGGHTEIGPRIPTIGRGMACRSAAALPWMKGAGTSKRKARVHVPVVPLFGAADETTKVRARIAWANGKGDNG